jgi:hypothetical protein
MLNHNQTAMVLVIGLVAVLMTLASTRVFAQPTSPPSQTETPADQHHPVESEITADQHAKELKELYQFHLHPQPNFVIHHCCE